MWTSTARPTPAAAASLLATSPDGRIKLHVIRQGLALRARRQALFSGSDYRPLAVRGARERHAIAFARTRGRSALVADDLAAHRLVRLFDIEIEDADSWFVVWREPLRCDPQAHEALRQWLADEPIADVPSHAISV